MANKKPEGHSVDDVFGAPPADAPKTFTSAEVESIVQNAVQKALADKADEMANELLAKRSGAMLGRDGFDGSVTLVNLDSKNRTFRYNGREFVLIPGRTGGVPPVMVRYAKDQNPVMGTDHPYNPMIVTSWIRVEGKDDLSRPILKGGKEAVERLDRSLVVGVGRHAKVEENPVGLTPLEARVAQLDVTAGDEDESGYIDQRADGIAISQPAFGPNA